MKLSISVTLLIVFIGAGFGMKGHTRLAETREIHRRLVAEAGGLGITIDRSDPTGHDAVRSKRPREDRDKIARQVATDLIAMAKEAEDLQKAGEGDDPEIQKKHMEFMDRLMALDPAQLRIVIAALREDKSLGDEIRQGAAALSIVMLSSSNPKAALALFGESSDFLADGIMAKHVVSSSLANWAKDDPLEALEWMRKNSGIHPDLMTDDARKSILSGAASRDPKLAFGLIAELKLEDPGSALQSIVEACKSPDERTAALAATRDFLKSLENGETRADMENRFFSSLADEVAGDGFDKAMPWLSRSKLDSAEMANFANGLSYQSTAGDTGKWLDWMAQSLPQERSALSTELLMNEWTQQDFKAAGTWLSHAEEGPVKTTAIRSYAETVAEYDPQTAAQWALTLPAGRDRDATLLTIHKKWPVNDVEGKAAFAEEHGINR